jgi:hypothetical protein
MPRPGPARPNWQWRPEPASQEVVGAWCRARGLSLQTRGVLSQALNALVQAGAGAVDPAAPPAGWAPATGAVLVQPAGERCMVLQSVPGQPVPVWRLARVTRWHRDSADVLFDPDEPFADFGGGGGRFPRAAIAVRVPPAET